MQNSKLKERNFGAESARDVMTDLSPVLIIGCFCLSLLAFAILKFFYQQELMIEKLGVIGTLVAFLTAVVSQVVRLAFGLAGVRDLTRGNQIIGWSGILASFALTVYEHQEAVRMAEHWGNPELAFIFLFLVWVALFAEIRLIFTMSSFEKKAKKPVNKKELNKKEQKPLPSREPNFEFDYSPNPNGVNQT